MLSFEWKMRKFTDSDFELRLGRGESTVLLTSVYPQAALVLSSALGTPQQRARGSVPAVPSAGTALLGLCVSKAQLKPLAMWESV